MKKHNWILAGIVLLKFVLQYTLVNNIYELHRDEYLYLDQGNHLAWGYFSVPPFISWVSLIIKGLGNSVFWVKFFPALFGTLTIVVVWKCVETLKGNLFALILAAACVLFSSLLRLNMLYQPNSFDVLAWTSLYFFLVKYFDTKHSKWLYFSAVVLAFGILNKYNILFLAAGLLPALLFTESRALFKNKHFYYALGLAFIVVLPNLIWQYMNDYPVLQHMKLLTQYQLVHVNRADFMIDQIFFFFGSIPCLLAAFYALLFYDPFKKFLFIFLSLFFTLAIFLMLRAKSYYAIGLYPIFIAFGSVYLSEVLASGWKKYVRLAVLIIPILLLYPLAQRAMPLKTPEVYFKFAESNPDEGMHTWEDGKKYPISQDFADMVGWKELADKVEKAYNNMPNPEKTLVLCDGYGQAGAINFYTNGRVKAHSFNADYIDWFDTEKSYKNLIRVKEPQSNTDEMQETSPHFETSALVDSVSNRYARDSGTKIYAFTKTKVDINARIKTEIDEIRKRGRY